MTSAHSRIVFGIAITLSLTGCSLVDERSRETGQNIRDSLEEATVYEPPGEAATRDVLMPQMDPVVDAPPPEERFDIVVDDAPARQFFMSLVEDTDWNMVVHPDVGGTVSLELKDVTIPEVMEMTREIYGYEYRRTETGYLVLPATLQSRIYQVNYLDVKRSGSSRTRVSSGQSTENPAALRSDSEDGRNSGSRRDGDERDAERFSGTRIETESESQFWTDLKQGLETLIGEGEGRNVVVNTQAGIVSVRAMPEDQRAVQRLLEAIQGSVQRQVILEAKIIEVELRDAFRSGINWTALAEIGDADLTFGQVAGHDLFDQGTAITRESPVPVTPGNQVTGFNTTAFGGPFSFAADATDFNAFIELLERQGKTQVLSSPRVATVNNQKAVIKVGTDEFFVTDVESQTATGTAAATTSRSVELTPFFSGIALDVIPQISDSGEVILHIHPTVSEVTEQTKTFTVDSGDEGTFSLPLAFSSVRESDSIIRARNGQVVVIGGLMKDNTQQDRIGTPVLSRIPLIGDLFGSRQETSTKTELVILLRPIVIGSGESWAEQVRQPLERVRGMTGARSQ